MHLCQHRFKIDNLVRSNDPVIVKTIAFLTRIHLCRSSHAERVYRVEGRQRDGSSKRVGGLQWLLDGHGLHFLEACS